MKKLRWGILGLGKIAHKMAHDLQLSEKSELRAVASRQASKSRDFAKKYDLNRAYPSYQELCDDPEIDLVYIATPHAFHYEQCIMALKADKGVLCEKPMAMNANQVEEMINLARKQNAFLMEAMWTRFFPATEMLLKLLAEERIGAIKTIEAEFSFAAPFDAKSRLFDPELGGGALLDIGIYPLYLSHLLLGRPKHIEAQGQLTQNGVDLAVEVLMHYEAGIKSQWRSSFTQSPPVIARIKGDYGEIIMQHRFHQCERLSLLSHGRWEEMEIPFQGLGYYHEIKAVEECLRKGQIENPMHNWQASLGLAQDLDHIRDQIKLTET